MFVFFKTAEREKERSEKRAMFCLTYKNGCECNKSRAKEMVGNGTRVNSVRGSSDFVVVVVQ
jgi:hypothetical protein